MDDPTPPTPPADPTPPAPPPSPPPIDQADPPPPSPPAPPPDDPTPPPAPEFTPLTSEALTIPEGFDMREEGMGKFLEIVNTMGAEDFSAANMGNQLLELYAGAVKELEEARVAEWDKLQNTWIEEVRTAHGDKLESVQADVGKLINAHGDEDLRKALALTGAGNHPAVVRFFHKIAGLVNEPKPVVPGSQGQPESAAKKIFPSMEA